MNLKPFPHYHPQRDGLWFHLVEDDNQGLWQGVLGGDVASALLHHPKWRVYVGH